MCINIMLILHSSPHLIGTFDVSAVSMASSSSFAPPKLADFILTERLGSGTYATVYKAYRKVSLWSSGRGEHDHNELKVCLRGAAVRFPVLHLTFLTILNEL